MNFDFQSESSDTLLTAGRHRPLWHTLGIRCSFRVPGSLKYRTYRFYGPTLPLAIPSAMWFSLSQLRPSQLSDRCALSSSSAFLQSLTNVS
jgi:hypothetical protein